MRSLFLRSRYHLISILAHAIVILLLTLLSIQEARTIPAFETSVFFESNPVHRKKTESSTIKSRKSENKPKAVTVETKPIKKKIDPVTKKAASDILLSKELLEQSSAITKPNNIIPFLKSEKQNNRIKSSEELEELFKKREYRIPYSKKPPQKVQKNQFQPGKDSKPGISDLKKNDPIQSTASIKPLINSADKDKSSAQIWKQKNDLMVYRSTLGKLITANWVVPPVSVKKFQVLITAFIDPEGNLIRMSLVKSSGLAILDAAAERAIRVSTPFPAYPKSFNPELTSFRAVFRFTPERVGL